jgi:O-acetyl-ADP-ribose deacetylase (regulator of RNase III)
MNLMLKHTKGNLIDLAEQGEFDVIVHGCNCLNTMGSGIAKEIRSRYPGAYRADSVMHKDDHFNVDFNPIELLGNFSWTTDTDNFWNDKHKFKIVNAYTQLNYLPRGIDHFEYDSFKLILRKLAAIWPKYRYGFPYIGMGLAGGDAGRIIAILEAFAHQITKTGGSVTLVEFTS